LFWPRTNTRWLLTTQRLTEKAYFIGEAKRAVYSINLRKEDGTIITFWAALKGPSEEKTGEVKANKVVVDTPNNSMTLWFGAYDGATEIKRYSKIMVAGKVWRVESVNNSTTSGLVEMHLVEDYTDKLKDNFEEQIARDTIPEVIPVAAHVITGMDIVDPLVGLTQVYTIDITGGTWEFEGPGLIVESSNQSATIQFTGAIGTATLRYVAQDAAVFNKIIKVTSIFG
jgi:hypothetical protein